MGYAGPPVIKALRGLSQRLLAQQEQNPLPQLAVQAKRLAAQEVFSRYGAWKVVVQAANCSAGIGAAIKYP